MFTRTSSWSGSAEALDRWENALVDQAIDAPGLLLLARDGSVLSTNAAANQWLNELRDAASDRMLPIEIYAVAASLRRAADANAARPRLRVRTRAGRWAVLHASWVGAANDDTIAVIIERAAPLEIAPLVMAAHGLTSRRELVATILKEDYLPRGRADHPIGYFRRPSG